MISGLKIKNFKTDEPSIPSLPLDKFKSDSSSCDICAQATSFGFGFWRQENHENLQSKAKASSSLLLFLAFYFIFLLPSFPIEYGFIPFAEKVGRLQLIRPGMPWKCEQVWASRAWTPIECSTSLDTPFVLHSPHPRGKNTHRKHPRAECRCNGKWAPAFWHSQSWDNRGQ